jgi:hypothetical protein
VNLDLDAWLPDAALRVRHRREADAAPDRLWAAARAVRLGDAGVLGRLVRWRIPGVPAEMTFDELFRSPPFTVLLDRDHALVSGLVGRIWTLRRDYPELAGPDEFRSWSTAGTAQVVFANWVDTGPTLVSETRACAIGRQGQLGLAAVRPLVTAFHALIGSDGLAAAVRAAEGGN